MWRQSGETEKKREKREKGVKKEPFELVGEIFSPSRGVEALNVENTALVGHLRSSGWKRPRKQSSSEVTELASAGHAACGITTHL